jgi:hypothetical protein
MNFTRCTPATYQGGERVKLLRDFTLHPVGSPPSEKASLAGIARLARVREGRPTTSLAQPPCLPRATGAQIGPDNGHSPALSERAALVRASANPAQLCAL